MNAPLCHFCASTPMREKARIPHIGAMGIPLGHVVIYQCEMCKRIESQTE